MALSNFVERSWLLSHGVSAAEYGAMTPHQRLGRVLVLQMEAEMAQMKRGLEILNRPP